MLSQDAGRRIALSLPDDDVAPSNRRTPMKRPYSESEMELPPGKTCSDCEHFPRCAAMFGHVAEDEVCDFFPSRYWPKVADVAATPEPDCSLYRADGGAS